MMVPLPIMTALVTGVFLLLGTLLKSYVDFRTAQINAETARKAQEALERKDAWSEVHREIENKEKLQLRFDALLREHISLYSKYVVVVAGGPVSNDVNKIIAAVDTYYKTLMGSEDEIAKTALVQGEKS